MQDNNRLPVALLAMRLSIFLVMLVWTLDKFLDPAHAAGVFEHFYFMKGIGPSVMYAVGALELAIIAGFVLGIAKRFTYGTVLALHTVSTLMPMQMYFNPSQGRLFFAAWPMLAACFALYLLRENDTLWTASRSKQ